MPALPVVPGVIKVELSGTMSAYNWANILHMQYTGGPPDTADLTTFCAALEASYNTNIKQFFNQDTILTKIQATDLATNTGASGDWTGSVAGGETASGAPANACVLMDYPSSYRYRGGHPRTYWPPFTWSDMADQNHWATSRVSTFTTDMVTFLGLLYSSTYSSFTAAGQCAVSYVNKALNPTPPYRRTTALVMPITQNSWLVKTEIASQRRRIGRK